MSSVLKIQTSLDSEAMAEVKQSPEKVGKKGLEERLSEQKNMLLSILSKDDIFHIHRNIHHNFPSQQQQPHQQANS